MRLSNILYKYTYYASVMFRMILEMGDKMNWRKPPVTTRLTFFHITIRGTIKFPSKTNNYQ